MKLVGVIDAISGNDNQCRKMNERSEVRKKEGQLRESRQERSRKGHHYADRSYIYDHHNPANGHQKISVVAGQTDSDKLDDDGKAEGAREESKRIT